MNALNGYKTYICAICIGIATALKYAGIIDESIFESVIAVLAALGLTAARYGAVKG